MTLMFIDPTLARGGELAPPPSPRDGAAMVQAHHENQMDNAPFPENIVVSRDNETTYSYQITFLGAGFDTDVPKLEVVTRYAPHYAERLGSTPSRARLARARAPNRDGGGDI